MNANTFSLKSLEDLPSLAEDLPVFDTALAKAAREREAALTKPQGSLGELEEIAIFMAGWQGRDKPSADNAQAVVFAGNHGVCAQGVNPFPQEVTRQMVANYEAGGAAINQICRVNGAKLSAVSLELDRPTQDFTEAPAMSVSECLEAMNAGAEAVDPQADVFIPGEMGIGNTTIAAALAAGIFGGRGKDWAGPGTGADAAGMKRKIRAIDLGLARHAGLKGQPGMILAALGGREEAAIAGAVLAARAHRIPVILDGFICTASVAPLYAADPRLLDHCLVGHVSAEPGHRRLVSAINKKPILGLNMRLGEGTGAALALGIVKAAVACHNGMATFAEAGVSDA